MPEVVNSGAPDISLIGRSTPMVRLKEKIGKLALSLAPVSIWGESGVGKELAARAIHDGGTRSSQPFVAINCGAIPEQLAEAELFGHVKGSFTGALTSGKGLFRAADGGTLFLDELAELRPDVQVKLLRVLQEGRVRPIGGQREIPVDVRILSATQERLAGLVAAGRLRHDLYYRVNVIELHVPSLRQRRQDIPELVGWILGHRRGKCDHAGPDISAAAIDLLMHYDFPGNVRELRNILERAAALCEHQCIEATDLSLPERQQPSPWQWAPQRDNHHGLPGPISNGKSLPDHLRRIEQGILLETLRDTKWNRTMAANRLGITVRALRYRLEKLGVG